MSALIFVALAVAWAVYLIPLALRSHEDDASSRNVEGFSDRLRVLARREPVSSREAALVTSDGAEIKAEIKAEVEIKPEAEVTVEPETDASITESAVAPVLTPRPLASRRAAARRAAARRRRVFNVLAMAILVSVACVIGQVFSAVWISIPVALMAAWLVACRLMVSRERAARVRRPRRTLADEAIAAEDAAVVDDPSAADTDADTDEVPVVPDADRWAPVEVPLPTYVAKAPAARSVRTIDLDSTGVWSSGRNEIDSELAREADAQRARASEDEPGERRATGS